MDRKPVCQSVLALALAVASGCGGARDVAAANPGNGSAGSAVPIPTPTGADCPRFAERVVGVLVSRAPKDHPISDADHSRAIGDMAAECGKAVEAADPDATTAIGCVLVAKDDDGVGACLAPAARAYAARSKKEDAAETLARLSKSATAYFTKNAAFPRGTASEPADACCKAPDLNCAASSPAPGTVWAALDFVRDEPGPFQYHYESDGQAATATATADLDCDGHPTTFTLHLTVQNGVPVSTLDTPPEK